MKSARRFLTPGWILTAVVAVAFSYLAFTVLAPWQLGKNTATQHRNEQLERSFELTPVDIDELLPKGKGFTDGNEWRRVTAQGEFVPNTEVLLRNRPVNGAPAIQVLGVFRADNGENYLVNRGFVRPTDSGTPTIAPPPTGQVTVSAHLRRNETPAETAPIPDNPPQVYGINTDEISTLLNTELNPDWLQLTADSTGATEAIPLPTLESGPYLSYGIQWIFFGAIVPLAVVWFIRAEIVESRRDREEQEQMAENLLNAKDTEPADTQLSEGAHTTADDYDSGNSSSAPENLESQPSEEKRQSTPHHSEVSERNATRDEQAEERRRRMAQRYGNTGHRASGYRDDRYDERF